MSGWFWRVRINVWSLMIVYVSKICVLLSKWIISVLPDVSQLKCSAGSLNGGMLSSI